MDKTIHVRFQMSEETWNKVIVDSLGKGEEPYVLYEGQEHFDVEYNNQTKWNSALNRFEGTVEYEILKTDLTP